jgi:hypothetical protein
MSTVRIVRDDGILLGVDVIHDGFDPPHPDGALPLFQGLSPIHMANGTTEPVEPITVTVRNGRLSIDAVEGGAPIIVVLPPEEPQNT